MANIIREWGLQTYQDSARRETIKGDKKKKKKKKTLTERLLARYSKDIQK